ncbi:hypothetical protein KVR01_005657 [Diaporthe batatas]|uniref:uncharacterized protein n=1 Tax=Diaporthe batatas TaxID=748121 RepID=UPI001D038428|nr:uncharacterized protein KVR01_005657 [Diaporthe batatas]KAG8165382.1 hypothetical protein KVR01_005657 [Diaporthe batatas]
MSSHKQKSHGFCIVCILCCCMISLALGQSYDYKFNVAEAYHTKRQLGGSIIVTTGMPVGPGPVPSRPDIHDLQNDQDKWTLYILALDMMQWTDQSFPTSWFAISGLHGVPFEPWSEVYPTPGNEYTGYCHHQDILFPTWHRAYVALYEQELCQRMQFIATTYSGAAKNRFESAAADCRAPYFDWATLPVTSRDSMLPASIGGNPKINVSGPHGTQTIDNPLFAYSFKPPSRGVFENVAPWADWTATRRAPTSTQPDAMSNNSAINTNLMLYISQNQQRLYNLFTGYSNYTIFSNEGWSIDDTKQDSLENLHDNLHAELGGHQGHMTIVPFSAFDPLFFLHHCNVDRIFAIWQGLHPDAWIVPEAARVNSYTTSVGQILDSASPLTPFYSNVNGDFWTSDMLRDTAALGYTYSELASSGISLSNKTSVLNGQAQLTTIVNRLYDSYSPNSLKAQSKRSNRRGNPVRHGRDEEGWYMGRGRRSIASLPVTKIISEQGKYREWIANVRVMRQALDGPFTVNLDLGGPDGQTLYVGSMGVFASPPSIASLKKLAPGAEYIAGTVPLTAALVDEVAEGTLASMDHADVEPFLREYLSTRVVRGDGAEADPAGVAGLSIEVVSWPVQATSSEEQLPTWGEADYKIRIM